MKLHSLLPTLGLSALLLAGCTQSMSASAESGDTGVAVDASVECPYAGKADCSAEQAAECTPEKKAECAAKMKCCSKDEAGTDS